MPKILKHQILSILFVRSFARNYMNLKIYIGTNEVDDFSPFKAIFVLSYQILGIDNLFTKKKNLCMWIGIGDFALPTAPPLSLKRPFPISRY